MSACRIASLALLIGGLSIVSRPAASQAALPVARVTSAEPAALDAFDLRPTAATQVTLAHALREISDLAVTADGRLLAIGDERAVVFEVDPASGAIRRRFTLGAPPVRGDFEGLASGAGHLFALTSTGLLYTFDEAADRDSAPFTVRDTGLGARCELEGIAYQAADRTLLLACKHPSAEDLRGLVSVFRWTVSGGPATPPRVSAPLSEILRRGGGKAFHPSAIARDPRTGHWLLVAGPQRMLAELTAEGAVVATRALDHRLHRQPEGLAFLGDSVMIISDEGGKGRATLTTYRRAR